MLTKKLLLNIGLAAAVGMLATACTPPVRPAAVAPSAAPPQPAATSAPSGLVVRYNTKFEVAKPPAQFDLVYLVQDFAPGAASAIHSHGGQGFATVLEGEITIRLKDGEKKYKAGETFTESANEVLQAVNTSSAKASFSIVFLLPKGATLTTAAP